MTALEATKILGATASFECGTLKFRVTIKDARESFGATQYLIVPSAGHGSKWVNATSVKMITTFK